MYDHYLPVLSVRISSIFDIVKSVVLHGTIKAWQILSDGHVTVDIFRHKPGIFKIFDSFFMRRPLTVLVQIDKNIVMKTDILNHDPIYCRATGEPYLLTESWHLAYVIVERFFSRHSPSLQYLKQISMWILPHHHTALPVPWHGRGDLWILATDAVILSSLRWPWDN